MTGEGESYGTDLAHVHDRSGAWHAAACAPGIIERLADVGERGGLVLELGCGSGPLTAALIAAGHRVLATDGSPAMVALARERVGTGAEDIRQLVLGVDPIPAADAIVAVGHPLNYLADANEFERVLASIARRLRPGGVLALDVCDLAWGRRELTPLGRVGEDWAIITQFSVPAPDRFVREITTFVPDGDGAWRRGSERHDSVLVDTARLPRLLAGLGVEATVAPSFGDESLPDDLWALVGVRRAGAAGQ